MRALTPETWLGESIRHLEKTSITHRSNVSEAPIIDQVHLLGDLVAKSVNVVLENEVVNLACVAGVISRHNHAGFEP